MPREHGLLGTLGVQNDVSTIIVVPGKRRVLITHNGLMDDNNLSYCLVSVNNARGVVSFYSDFFGRKFPGLFWKSGLSSKTLDVYFRSCYLRRKSLVFLRQILSVISRIYVFI